MKYINFKKEGTAANFATMLLLFSEGGELAEREATFGCSLTDNPSTSNVYRSGIVSTPNLKTEKLILSKFFSPTHKRTEGRAPL